MPRSRLASSEQIAAYRQERQSQLRGLLILAAVTLAIILVRADRQAIFHIGWWRF